MDDTPEDPEKLDAAVLAESKKSPAKTVLICPQCGYVGAFVIEGYVSDFIRHYY